MATSTSKSVRKKVKSFFSPANSTVSLDRSFRRFPSAEETASVSVQYRRGENEYIYGNSNRRIDTSERETLDEEEEEEEQQLSGDDEQPPKCNTIKDKHYTYRSCGSEPLYEVPVLDQRDENAPGPDRPERQQQQQQQQQPRHISVIPVQRDPYLSPKFAVIGALFLVFLFAMSLSSFSMHFSTKVAFRRLSAATKNIDSRLRSIEEYFATRGRE